jgi:glycerophosphoryl diester phosphodiesterase
MASLRILWVAALSFAAFALPKPSPPPALSPLRSLESVLPTRGVIAHRGASYTQPENTIAAFKEAIRLGVQGVEMDVRETKDGQLVLMHDFLVNRTTNGSGRISHMTLAEVKELDAGSWKGEKFRGEKVPTLEEALTIIPRNMWIDIHIKDDDATMKIAELVIKLGIQDQALLGCDDSYIEKLHQLDSRLKPLNMSRSLFNSRYVTNSIEKKAFGLQFIDLLGVVSSDDIAAAKAAGLYTNYCCTDGPVTIRRLFERKIDFVLSNDAETALRIFNFFAN